MAAPLFFTISLAVQGASRQYLYIWIADHLSLAPEGVRLYD